MEEDYFEYVYNHLILTIILQHFCCNLNGTNDKVLETSEQIYEPRGFSIVTF